jgi:ribosomal protein S18 acetylase RimI-like enzyme
MDKEKTYKDCYKIIKPYIKQKLMGPIFRGQIYNSIDKHLFISEFNNEELIGFCVLRFLKKTKIYSLDKIAVDERFLHTGLGKKMLLQALLLSKNELKLEVAASNLKAINFYIKHQFEVINEKFVGKNKDTKLIVMKYKT